jgi:anaerobic magnesium-protoporphyrin IX monomethyl ester cyclase
LRVLLVNPELRLPIDTRTTPHLGLAYLGAVSEERGDEVRLYDGDVEQQPVDQVAREFQPHLVGITANTPQVMAAWRAATAIKREMDVPVILGGPHVSIVCDDLDIESASRPEVNLVVRGEGEVVWAELSGRIDSFLRDSHSFSTAGLMAAEAGVFQDLQGVTYQTSAGKVIRNPDQPPIHDLDSLPWPAYHLFQMDRYTNLQPTVDKVEGARSFSIMTSRGCPYRCSFCSQSIMPVKWRARSASNVLAEWRHLVEDLGAEEIGVLDDSANIRRERLHELCDALIGQKLNHVPWIFVNGIRANLADYELLKHMKEAGLKRTAFGVESGDQIILNRINKRIELDTIRQAFADAKKAGVETIGFFILGLPGETEESMEKTIRFSIELDPLVANFSMMTPFPGTEVYEQVKREGQLLMNTWDDYVFFEGRARFEMGELTAELVERKWREAYRRFYLRPSRVLRTLLRKETWLQFPRTARMAWRTVMPKPDTRPSSSDSEARA